MKTRYFLFFYIVLPTSISVEMGGSVTDKFLFRQKFSATPSRLPCGTWLRLSIPYRNCPLIGYFVRSSQNPSISLAEWVPSHSSPHVSEAVQTLHLHRILAKQKPVATGFCAKIGGDGGNRTPVQKGTLGAGTNIEYFFGLNLISLK